MHDNVNIVSTEQKLLFDIRELLMEQNKKLDMLLLQDIKDIPKERKEIINEAIKEESSIVLEPIKIESNSKIPCKHCGGSHDNQGQILNCAKKNKKKKG